MSAGMAGRQRARGRTAAPDSGNAAAIRLLDELSSIEAATVVRCARVLLRRPLLRADGPDGDLLPLVFQHRAVLALLFSALLDYRLEVQRRWARLYKAGPGFDAGRGEPSLTPRGYAYLTLIVAALTGAGQQILLSRLVADVRAAATEADIEISDDLNDLRAMAAALRHLLALGVITETDGTVGTVADQAPAEALITIDTDLLGQLIAGPTAADARPDDLVRLASAGTADRLAQSVRRRLVEDPVVLYGDLPSDQADWLRANQRSEAALLEAVFGLVTERRAEGIAVADPEDYLTDVTFPGSSTVARIALLALPELLPDLPPETDVDRADGRTPVSYALVREVCAELVHEYPAAWSRTATEDLDSLATAVLELLTRLNLARPDGDLRWLLSPAAYRWVPEPDDTPVRRPRPVAADEMAEQTLFETVEPEHTTGAGHRAGAGNADGQDREVRA